MNNEFIIGNNQGKPEIPSHKWKQIIQDILHHPSMNPESVWSEMHFLYLCRLLTIIIAVVIIMITDDGLRLSAVRSTSTAQSQSAPKPGQRSPLGQHLRSRSGRCGKPNPSRTNRTNRTNQAIKHPKLCKQRETNSRPADRVDVYMDSDSDDWPRGDQWTGRDLGDR